MNLKALTEIKKCTFIIIVIFLLGIGNNKTFAQDIPEQVPEKKELGENDVYNHVETRPEFPGGLQAFYEFIGKNYRIPRVKNLKGKVFVQFVIEKDGSLGEIKVMRDIGHGTGEEAVRVLKKSPKWTPGSQDGKPVRVLYSLPIAIDAK